MATSKIEWTESTWNPVTGCTKISSGCKNCYAERMAKRLQMMGQPNYINGFQVSVHKHVLELPLRWKKPQTIFVNSMSDLFHEEVPDTFIFQVFEVMGQAYWHRFQILTKRSARLKKLNRKLNWPENVWIGVSVENNKVKFRIDDLRMVPSSVRFLSLEPLIGPIQNLDLIKIDWVIVGGESGPGARPMEKEWVLQIRKQCLAQGTPFFFKQWGGVNKKKNGRLLEGRTWDEMPNESVNNEKEMCHPSSFDIPRPYRGTWAVGKYNEVVKMQKHLHFSCTIFKTEATKKADFINEDRVGGVDVRFSGELRKNGYELYADLSTYVYHPRPHSSRNEWKRRVGRISRPNRR